MTHAHTQCCDVTISRMLDDALTEPERVAFEAHLEQCPRCNERLAASAASDRFWTDAATMLSQSDSLVELGTTKPLFEHDADVELHTRALVTRGIPLQPTDDPRMLGRFGGYEICGIIGRGGMGVVFKGWDRSLDRFVAIKVMNPTFAHQSAAWQRFAREAKAAAAVVHDNVVAIFGVDSCNDLPYLVMPYIKGESLQKRIDREAPLKLDEILEISVQIARGLQAAHDQGVIHRDIKPANVLLPQSVSRVFITDFGLARAADDVSLTYSGVVAGTPAYMSPEQARGESVDHRSDLFSLGSVIYAMATGHPPFRADSTYGLLHRIIDEPHRPLASIRGDLPRWFADLVDRLLAKNPVIRIQSAKALADHLELCLAHVRQPTINPLPGLKSNRRTGLFTLVWVAATLLICSATLWMTWKSPSISTSNSTAAVDALTKEVWSDFDAELEQLENTIAQLKTEK